MAPWKPKRLFMRVGKDDILDFWGASCCIGDSWRVLVRWMFGFLGVFV